PQAGRGVGAVRERHPWRQGAAVRALSLGRGAGGNLSRAARVLRRWRAWRGLIMAATDEAAATRAHRPWYTVLYVQVLIAIAIGIFIGHYFPKAGVALKPLGDGFIALIKMMIGPVIFCTVVHGIGSMSDLKKIGRVGVKTLFYFEAVS